MKIPTHPTKSDSLRRDILVDTVLATFTTETALFDTAESDNQNINQPS